MMSMKRMVASNKACTYMAITLMGAAVGMTVAKTLIKHCCCAERLKCKAKKAIHAMEDKFLD